MTDDSPRPMHFATRAVHAGRVSDGLGSVAPPLVQGVNFEQPRGVASVPRYTRYNNTPTIVLVQQRLASLEGSEAAVCLSSGMGATSCAMLALLRPGDHLLSSAWIYGGTHRLFTEELPKMGIEVTFVDPLESRGWRLGMKDNTRAIFVETPVNPTCRVLDLKPISALTRELGVALVVDSTFASPVNLRPLEHGADIVIASTTKYLNGHHDMLGGAVFGSQAYIDEVTQKMMVWGQAPDPFACWLLERGLKTLHIRVQRQNENAMALAQWCEAHPAFAKVHYPGLPSHADHALAASTMDGFGGMLSLELVGGAAAADRMVEKLALVLHAVSLGGVDTLICEPRFSSHAHMTSGQRAEIGIPDGFLRVSVGIEDVRDIIADFSQALA
ncbi:MAG: PLP-dependent transferase [Gemmatimonadaceae bacterium]|nr:PLP-dependent transferase [Gemmatimonadaceae bacterium]